MHNLVLSDVFIAVIIFYALRAVFYFFKIYYLKSKLPELKREHQSLLASSSDAQNVVLQAQPVFTISGMYKDETTPQDLPVVDLGVSHRSAFAAYSEQDFVMPSTAEEWKVYDEPTYLRRGLFLS